jgi:hypothetical protein
MNCSPALATVNRSEPAVYLPVTALAIQQLGPKILGAEEFFERAVFLRKRIYGPICAVLLSRPAPAGREAERGVLKTVLRPNPRLTIKIWKRAAADLLLRTRGLLTALGGKLHW